MTREQILSLLRERILAYAASRIGRDAAEDLAQETLMVIQQRYSHLGDVTDLMPLSFQIIRFKIMARQRKVTRRGEHNSVPVDGTSLSDPSQDPEALARRAELKRHLLSALAGLGDRCRTLFRLKLDGHSFEEIRVRLGAATLNTVYTWDLRCRQELKVRMGLGATAKEPS